MVDGGVSITRLVSTNVELHACKVTEVGFGDDPPGGTRSQALPYYAERSVPLWFRVEDVRALSSF